MRPIAEIKRERRTVVSTLPGAHPKKRVLVADDDPATGSALSLPAKAERCDIVTAMDGSQAYRILRTDDDFQAIVINPLMPGIDGFELLRYLKSENRLKRIPIVIVVSEDGLKVIAQGFAAGAIACMWKPVSGDVLWRTVRMLLPQNIIRRKAA